MALLKHMVQSLRRTKSDNIDAKLDKIKVTPNTMNAHRIIHWSKIEVVKIK